MMLFPGNANAEKGLREMDLSPVMRTDRSFPVFEYIPVTESPKRARLGNAKLPVSRELDDMVRAAAEEAGNVPGSEQFLL
jgi:hypothetical protein